MLQLTIESRDTRDPKRLVAKINGRRDGKKLKIKNKK